MEERTLILPAQTATALRWEGDPDSLADILTVFGDHVRFDSARRHLIPAVHYELWLYPTVDGAAQYVPVGYWIVYAPALELAWSVSALALETRYGAPLLGSAGTVEHTGDHGDH